MSLVRELARFVVGSRWDDVPAAAADALRVRLLDSLGCAVGALGGPPIAALHRQLEDFGGHPRCSLISGGATAPDLAALFNGALVRYLDFNDSYLAPGETCHPSDNIAAVLAAAEYAGADGPTALTAIAVAYQVQCRLSDVAPVRKHGFDHTTQGAYSVAAGVSRALGLGETETANALAIAGTALNALRVTRTGSLSNWKGLAFPFTAFAATHAAFLASRGITGPEEVFEGNKGFMDAIAGRFEIDWGAEGLDAVTRTSIKRFNAEFHSQSALEAAVELKQQEGLSGDDIERVEVDVFQVAYDIIGGGEEGEKTSVRTKEEADHSLPYMVAVALLDGEVTPAQYTPERIAAADVQSLLRRVEVRPDDELSGRFPAEHCARLRIHLRDGRVLERDKDDYEGFHSRPARWETVVDKFNTLAEPFADESTRTAIIHAVEDLQHSDSLKGLMEPLAAVRAPWKEG